MIRKALLAAVLGAWLLAPAAQPPVDNAQTLLSKYIAWRGGPLFAALESVHSKGTTRIGEVDGRFEHG